MTQEDIIQTILKDSNYHLSLFTKEEIDTLRAKIFTKQVRGKESPFVTCIVRDKDIQLNPEEIVRQLYAARLMQEYVYPKKRLAFEYPINFGREIKSADIVVFDKDRPDTSYIMPTYAIGVVSAFICVHLRFINFRNLIKRGVAL